MYLVYYEDGVGAWLFYFWSNYYYSHWPRPVILVQKVLKMTALVGMMRKMMCLRYLDHKLDGD